MSILGYRSPQLHLCVLKKKKPTLGLKFAVWFLELKLVYWIYQSHRGPRNKKPLVGRKVMTHFPTERHRKNMSWLPWRPNVFPRYTHQLLSFPALLFHWQGFWEMPLHLSSEVWNFLTLFHRVQHGGSTDGASLLETLGTRVFQTFWDLEYLHIYTEISWRWDPRQTPSSFMFPVHHYALCEGKLIQYFCVAAFWLRPIPWDHGQFSTCHILLVFKVSNVGAFWIRNVQSMLVSWFPGRINTYKHLEKAL